MKVKKLIDEYLILPFPEIQPDFCLKIELWKCQNEYLPIIYVRDVFKLPQTLVCSKRQHRKNITYGWKTSGVYFRKTAQ